MFRCRNLAAAVLGSALALSAVPPASAATPETDRTVHAAPGFKCTPADSYRHTKRRAPIRRGMSGKASIKAMVPKGRVVHIQYRCTNSRGKHWVKTASPAKGYLASWNLTR